ncbi:DEAD/DEAH box helicase [Spirulina subsalsa FACHB-351]|uniref:DEAD/DEAH box helicase n=1 Tax=Spirulina subsalsa FACHB-351 TaxID=234711 RepID=A0ABT3L696_9CYAN|nr:DEAD/DEAH box helicase [Spirulina subsalsa]MCW6037005.1 DEAD/DEAH box helicase [Spirulina subsalsa FACHB-351]
MTISFKSLGLSDVRVEHLEAMGFSEPTEIQTQAIPQLLAGRDVVGQSQTGTGKTAAYSLPILEQIDLQGSEVQALILTPTRELAQQVAQAIEDFWVNRKLRVLTVCGGQSIERQIRSLRRGVHIVVGTPGRVIDLLDRNELNLDQLQWVVLDEADEMLSMGFIDDVKKILRTTPEQRKTCCFSATMPGAIRELVQQFLKSPVTVTVSQPKAAPTRIEQKIYMVPRSWTKIKALLPILEMEDPESGIIFVRTKRSAAEITSKLQDAGHSVDEYHGDLSQNQRERLVQRFRSGQVRLVVATDIAARGLDVEDLSHVINYDLPDNTETYIHRIGRTGRAGKTGTAISLIQPMDRYLLRRIERRVRQTLAVDKIPSRSDVEAHRLSKLQSKVQETLAGERMASFLSTVKELSAEYDPQAIAAAALQMVYDQSCPNWLKSDWDVPNIDPNKPIKRSQLRKLGKQNSEDSSDSLPKKSAVPNKAR